MNLKLEEEKKTNYEFAKKQSQKRKVLIDNFPGQKQSDKFTQKNCRLNFIWFKSV